LSNTTSIGNTNTTSWSEKYIIEIILHKGRIKWTRGSGQSRYREAPKTLSTTA